MNQRTSFSGFMIMLETALCTVNHQHLSAYYLGDVKKKVSNITLPFKEGLQRFNNQY